MTADEVLAACRKGGPEVALAVLLGKLAEVQAELASNREAVDLLAEIVAAGSSGLLGVKAACRYLSVKESKFFDLLSMGLIPEAVGFGGPKRHDPRWRRADLERCVAKLKPQRSPAAKPKPVGTGS